jgi:hypothetical protein
MERNQCHESLLAKVYPYLAAIGRPKKALRKGGGEGGKKRRPGGYLLSHGCP